MLRSALSRLPSKHRASALHPQKTSSRWRETATKEKSHPITDQLNGSIDVTYRHTESLGWRCSAPTHRHTQQISWQPFSSSQHDAQQGKEAQHDGHKQASDCSAAKEPATAPEQMPAGNAQQGSQPVFKGNQGQADSCSSTSEQPSTSEADSDRRLRERDAWLNSDDYARMSAQMKRMAGLNKLESGVTTDTSTLFGPIIRPLRSIRGRLSVRVMKLIDPEFDEAEFLEGACDAYYIVTKLWNEQDWDAMQPMMSRKMLDALRGTTADYKSHNLTMRVETGDDIRAAVDNIGFIDQAGADWYGLPGDEEEEGFTSTPSSRSADPGGPGLDPAAIAGAAAGLRPTATAALPLPGITGASGGSSSVYERDRDMWRHVILTVRFNSEETSTVVNSGGAVVQELKDMRQHLWRFCWGPLCAAHPLPLVAWALKPVPRLPRPTWRLLDLK